MKMIRTMCVIVVLSAACMYMSAVDDIQPITNSLLTEQLTKFEPILNKLTVILGNIDTSLQKDVEQQKELLALQKRLERESEKRVKELLSFLKTTVKNDKENNRDK